MTDKDYEGQDSEKKGNPTFWLWVIIAILVGAIVVLLYYFWKKPKPAQSIKLNKISAGALIVFALLSLANNLGVIDLTPYPFLITFINIYVPVNGIAEALKILEIGKTFGRMATA